MGTVDIGVRHDDDAFVAQALLAIGITDTTSQGLDQITQFLIGADLVGRGAGDVEDFAAQGQDSLGFTLPALFGRTAGGIPLDDENLRPVGRIAGAIGKLAGKAQAAGRRLPFHLPVLAPSQPHLGMLDDRA